ncbi:hypothetical protein Emed_006023 [Eimeria media]
MLPQSVDLNGSQEEVHARMQRLLLFSLARESAFVVLQQKRNYLKTQTQQLQRLRELEVKQLRQEEEQQRQLKTLREKRDFLSSSLERVLQDLRLLPGGDVLLESAASLRACCEEALSLKEAIGRMSGDTEGDQWTTETQGLSLPTDCLLGADAELLAAEERLFALEAEVDASLRELPALEGLQQHLLEKAISSIPGKPSQEFRNQPSSSYRAFNSTSGELVKKQEGGGCGSSGLMLLSSDPAMIQREGERDEVASLSDTPITSSRPIIPHEKEPNLHPISAVYEHLEGESVKRAEGAADIEQERNPRCSPSHEERDRATNLHSVEEPWLLEGKGAAGRELHAARQHPPFKNAESISDGICMHATEVEGFPQEWRGFSSQPQFQHLTGCSGSSVVTAEGIAVEESSNKEAGGLQREVLSSLVEGAMTGHAADRVQEQLELDVNADESDVLRLHAAASERAAGVAVYRQRVEVPKTHSKNCESDERKSLFSGVVVSTEKEKEESREANSKPTAAAVVQPHFMITPTSCAKAQFLDVEKTQSIKEEALLKPERRGDLTAAAAAVAFEEQSGIRISDLGVFTTDSLFDG